MKYGEVPGIEKPISRIVQGIIQVPRGDTEKDEKGFALLDAALEAGINTIDTAHVYGPADVFLGRWITSRGIRDKVVVLAKGAHHNDFRKRVTPYDIGADLHDTLARMKTDYIDLYVLHRDDPDYPVEPIVDALNQFTREGKIKAFGGSNWTTDRLVAANEYAKQSGQIPFAVSSPNFSLADQKQEPWQGCVSISGPGKEAERQWYVTNKLPLFTWSSMAGGFMSGRITRDNLAEFTGGLDKLAVDCYAAEDNFERLDRAKAVADRHGLSLPQIALAYVLHYPLDIYALVGSATAEEIKANVVALNTDLTEAEMAYLDLRVSHLT
ncbi:MAG: aldo/keto reductase [Cytophagales bacterium]|nr:aldo/keto reductase [Armatimonadota bacterium]